MKHIIFALAIMLYAGAQAQDTNTNVYISYDQPFIPKKGSHVGITGSFDNTGILIGNFDIYPNNRVFVGVSFGSKDIINTEPLIFTEQLVAGRLGLRVLPWTYIVGSAGNHRFEPPVYQNYEGYLLSEGLPYKDEFFWSGGLQVNIPYPIFNKLRVTAGISFSNRNSYEFDQDAFKFTSLNEIGNTFNTLIKSDLTFTVGVRIPLTK